MASLAGKAGTPSFVGRGGLTSHVQNPLSAARYRDVGLTLARRLAELHGGSLLVRQEALGQGSEFALRLPPSVLCEAPDAAIDKLPAQGPGKGEISS